MSAEYSLPVISSHRCVCAGGLKFGSYSRRCCLRVHPLEDEADLLTQVAIDTDRESDLRGPVIDFSVEIKRSSILDGTLSERQPRALFSRKSARPRRAPQLELHHERPRPSWTSG
jgi:hypothetical protein